MKKKTSHPKSIIFNLNKISFSIGIMLLSQVANAAPMPLTQVPAVNLSRLPVPNVIVSVDDSGSMDGTKMATLKAALLDTFTAENVPDGSIRLAWQSMNRCYYIPSSGCNGNAIKILDQEHRNRFRNWVYGSGLIASGNTPSHRMLYYAGEYLKKPLDKDSAWAEKPGETLGKILSCRRSYNIFLTDGAWNYSTSEDPIHYLWNAPGRLHSLTNNEDNTSTTFPDGTFYNSSAVQSRIYRGTTEKMLADLAFKYWAEDLQPGIPNDLTPIYKQTEAEKGLTPYWNPRNNPATWQHLTIYGVGFGTGAAEWTSRPLWGKDTWSGTDYDNIIAGTRAWSAGREPDMWHASINTRGKFIPVVNAADLAPAFKDILNEILSDTIKPITSMTLSASTTRADSFQFLAGYDPQTWTGHVSAVKLKASDSTVDTSSTHWGSQNTAEIMQAAGYTARRIITSTSLGNAVLWNWNNLHSSQQLLLNKNGADTLGANRVAYIRGDQSMETPAGGFRKRSLIHGDIVNSKIWYAPGNSYQSMTRDSSRPNMIYVGSNGGMLHAFDASNGKEKLAYIPKGIMDKLPLLADIGYQYSHQYYVDGSPFTGDVFTDTGDTADARTYLAGFLGGGGRGYFVLNVTKPQNFDSTAPSNIVVMDETLLHNEATAGAREYIGHIYSDPVTDQVDKQISNQFVRMNDGRWALVMGNGYNSKKEQAALLIQFLEGSQELLAIPAGTAGNANGLAAPQLIDLNGDGIVDVAYAGDLKGNLWKFDLTNASSPSWKVAYGGTPFFKTPNLRPVTSAPAFSFHNDGLILMLGTGKSLTEADAAAIDEEYILAVLDETKFTSSGGAGSVVLDSSDPVSVGELVHKSLSSGADGWSLSNDVVDYTTKKGWYFAMPVGGARALSSPVWVTGTQFRQALTKPASGGGLSVGETCDPQFVAGNYYMANLSITSGSTASPPGQNTGSPTPTPPLTLTEEKDGVSGSLIDPKGKEHRIRLDEDPVIQNIFNFGSLNPTWRPVR